MRFRAFGLLLAFATTAENAAVPNSHVLHEKRNPSSSMQWVKRGKFSSTAILPIKIGLKQRNLHRGREFLMDM
jgi:tripeptidyl-peptidase-1